jgi:hypothetical protein
MVHPYTTDGRQSRQSIFEVATTVVGASEAIHPIGTRGILPDGRAFYYARNSAAASIAAGNLLMAEIQVAHFTEMAIGTPAIGDLTITPTIGATAVTLNEYAGGYIMGIDELGEGINYKIESHPAAAGTNACVITLTDPVEVVFHGSATVQMVKNPWADVVQSTAGQGHLPAGVSNKAIPAGNAVPQYFWCQTWGVVSGLCGEITAVGAAVCSDTGDAGSFEAVDAAGEYTAGINMWTSVDNEHTPIFLKIAP